MNNFRIKDISRSDLLNTNYDLAVFSAGYEPRCSHLITLLDKDKIGEHIVFSYQESSGEQKQINELNTFSHLGYVNQYQICHQEILVVYKLLVEQVSLISKKTNNPFRVLIDYSSMSRNWYAAILNYLLNHFEGEIEVNLSYSCGEYPIKEGFLNFELGDIKVLPGCQGSSITKLKSAGIFMLGFDKIGPLSFYNLLEPNLSFGIVSAPGAMPDYEEQARKINSQFIQHQLQDGKNLIGAPIDSVSQTFEHLCQLIRPIADNYNISIVQFGPKPHILASTLAGLSFPNVSCLYSEYKRSKTFDVKANGELVITSLVKNKHAIRPNSN